MKFFSFLGTGPDGDGYSEITYKNEGKDNTITTEFVQRAEIEFIGKDQFKKIYILCTDESFRNFFHDLRDELRDDLKVPDDIIEPVNIGKINQPKSAWALFEKVGGLISNGDTIVFDLTYGFRSLSIILSTALNYILKAKGNIHLKHVFYGEIDQRSKRNGWIIDMKDFYTVHEWADGVSRLIENADATKLASLARGEGNDTFQNLKNDALVNALKDLTDTLKNIDVNRIARNTKAAMSIIKSGRTENDGSEKELLELIEKKFQPLLTDNSEKYDDDYFINQVQIIRMLNEHKLFMQSFTVIRELIGSIGMLGAPETFQTNIWDNNAADKRRTYAELFVRMMRFTKDFKANPNEQARHEELKNSICKQIDKMGKLNELKDMTKKITEVRDGFDHAWTGKGDNAMSKIGDIETIANTAAKFFGQFINDLIKENIIQKAKKKE